MTTDPLDRRKFLANGAAGATLAGGAAVGAAAARAATESEAEMWRGLIRSSFDTSDQVALELRSVDVSRHVSDAERPLGMRTAAISLLFVTPDPLELTSTSIQSPKGDGELRLQRVIPPADGEPGSYFECVLN